MKISDFSGLLRKNTYALRKSYQAEDGCTVFELENPHTTTWISGQHGIFTIPGASFTGKKWRAFSIASTPEEETIQIATKISDTPSNFKAALRDLQPGDQIHMRGPIGWFYLQDETSPLVMIAGGVGITPIRALFKELEKGNRRSVTLIYSARDSYLYKSELDVIADRDPKISIIYTHTKDETGDAIQNALTSADPHSHFFISGAPKMIKSIRKTIADGGVKKSSIITDPFEGY